MDTVIQNKHLRVEVSANGAELRSIESRGTEYLWQGDARWWGGRAPNLFPYVARLTENSYLYAGQRYHMDIHGFVKDSLLTARPIGEDEVLFTLCDNSATREAYPFSFLYSVRYTLRDACLSVTYTVENRDTGTLYCGMGGHPGFNVPLAPGLAFDDYFLAFDAPCSPLQIGFSEERFLNGDDRPFPLENGQILRLEHALFDSDAIVLADTSGAVTLKCDRDSRAVTVRFPDMPYIGIWHWPKSDAPYVCIEPWLSLPSRQGVLEDLAKQPGLAAVAPGATYANTWSIEII